MVISYILILFCIALLLCSIFLSFLKFSPTWLRRVFKIVIFTSVIYCCFLHIQNKYKTTPYVPTYNPTVYVTNYGDHYHMSGCGYLWKSSIPSTLYDAVIENYYPCSRCDPWEYSDVLIAKIDSSLESPLPKLDEFILSKQYVICSSIVALIIFCSTESEKKANNIGRYPRLSKIRDYTFISYLFLFLPGVIIAFTFIYSLSIFATIIVIPLRSIIKKFKE